MAACHWVTAYNIRAWRDKVWLFNAALRGASSRIVPASACLGNVRRADGYNFTAVAWRANGVRGRPVVSSGGKYSKPGAP